MKRLGLILLMQCFVVYSFAEYSLRGTVLSESGEKLVGANLMLSGSYKGTSTNENGKYEFEKLKAGTYTLKVTYIGYEPKSISVNVDGETERNIRLEPRHIMAEEVLVSATRAGDKTPVAKTTVNQSTIESRNMGQDIPYLLTMTPSYVATSDAGAGVGYTNFRIRGTDLNRINVTVNGIPMNDAESHGTWFVDIPDLAGSIENIQIQRGVGTSTNGAAAFGATINLQTSTLNKDAYAEYRTSVGSFNTFKNSVSAGTGLLKDHFTFDVRLSKVNSDGFIDRASADLKSFFTSAGYYSENTVIKVNVFSGFEKTYQAWYGVPSAKLNNDVAGLERYRDHWLWNSHSARANEEQFDHVMNSDARTYNFYTYENEVDHYQQDHYQLHFSHQLNDFLNINAALHYTYGRGYYENYEYDEDFTDYQMTVPEGVEVTDLVARKWLDNDFYGATFSLNYERNNSAFTFGGGHSTYDGDHFGNVIWAQYMGENEKDHEWYRGTGLKKDFNVFGKYGYQLTEAFNLFADLQYRHIDYDIDGIDDDLRDLTQSHQYDFFNPKFGVFYRPSNAQEAYLSYAVAHREPTRSNFVDADPAGKQPVSETLRDLEAGYTYKTSTFLVGANLYYMSYEDQLIQTGEINDVGAPIMVNADDSYRAGIELAGGLKITRSLNWDGNVTFSQNKIKDFTEYVDNWDAGGQAAFSLGETNLAFSPNVIVNSQLKFKPAPAFSLSLLSNYVGDQYIDNTSSEDRKLDAWFINSLKIEYTSNCKFFDEVKLHLMVNNLFDVEYESNAWVYSYIYGDERYKMDGYFPQAGTHFFAGIDFKF
ncbi:TonB-dependent receptor [uncultured Sunxiuqinia sp.]|uniref:TonB-dependent receptor n=1 Tax=uncultured Sunxiuqinia sp. TaxID=1573825 RepID=UPI002AA959A0|nr:TonB-dependent receptor [uncultured Sunxiuqinia sp.]